MTAACEHCANIRALYAESEARAQRWRERVRELEREIERGKVAIEAARAGRGIEPIDPPSTIGEAINEAIERRRAAVLAKLADLAGTTPETCDAPNGEARCSLPALHDGGHVYSRRVRR